MKYLKLLLLFLFVLPVFAQNDPVVLEVGQLRVRLSEFQYAYEKNIQDQRAAYTRKSLEEYIKLLVNFKLKVNQALDEGYDKEADFGNELDMYRKQLAKPYLSDREASEKLVKEAYQRLKEEINASHILIELSPSTQAEDTAAAYKKIQAIRQKAIKGEDFGKLAQEFSQDPSAKQNQGNLGYFTALQMIYDFENNAYNTKIGQISPIFRTSYGYHILKVHERRPSKGSVKVAHILVRYDKAITKEDSAAAKQKVEKIRESLQKGEDWFKLCNEFSEDISTKTNGGELDWFSAGNMIPSFENAAFKLDKVGDVSNAVQTPYGWHLLKLIARKPLESFEQLEPILKQKISKDARSQIDQKRFLERIKKENKFLESPDTEQLVFSDISQSLLNGSWAFNRAADNLSKNLFGIGERKYSLKDFYEYLEKAQRPQNAQTSLKKYAKSLYDNFVTMSLISFEENQLSQKYPDYRMLVDEYKEGILLFKVMEKNVWTKAFSDEKELQVFFDKNKSSYQWKERAKVSIFSLDNEKTLEKLKEELKKDVRPDETVRLSETAFGRNSAELLQPQIESLRTVLDYLLRDSLSIVELQGYFAGQENSSVASFRLSAVKDYLVKQGIDNQRIAEKNLGKQNTQIAEEFAFGGVRYKIYSKSKRLIEQNLNKENQLAIQIREAIIEKGNLPLLEKISWKKGEYTVQEPDRLYYIVVENIYPAQQKKLEEVRGLVVSDYQNYLEQTWIDSLKAKYKVNINESDIFKLAK